MQRLEVSGAVQPLQGSSGVKGLICSEFPSQSCPRNFQGQIPKAKCLGHTLFFDLDKSTNIKTITQKGKSIPITGPEGSRKLRFPDYVTTAQDGGKVVSLTHRPPLTPRKYFRYSFLLEVESTPGPQYDRKDFMSTKKSNDTGWDRTSDLTICGTAP